MSEEIPEEPKAVLKCLDVNCNKPHYHLDPQAEKNEAIEKQEALTDRPEVEVIPDKTTT